MPEVDTPPIDPALIETTKSSSSGGAQSDCVSGTYKGNVVVNIGSSSLSLYEGQCTIEGNVTVAVGAKDAVKLSQLLHIQGSLDVVGAGNTTTELVVLSNLHTVSGNVTIKGGSGQYLPRLPLLETIGEQLMINGTNAKRINGFDSLKSAKRIRVQNTGATEVVTFNALQHVSDLRFSANYALTKLPKFDALTAAGSIYVEQSCGLSVVHFDKLAGPWPANSGLTIQLSKTGVHTFNLPAATNVAKLDIDRNPELVNITLPKLKAMQGLTLRNCAKMDSLSFMKDVKLSGTVVICYNGPAMTNDVIQAFAKSNGGTLYAGGCGVQETAAICQ